MKIVWARYFTLNTRLVPSAMSATPCFLVTFFPSGVACPPTERHRAVPQGRNDVSAGGQRRGTRSCATRCKRNSVPLVTYVPDNVLKPLIKAVARRQLFHRRSPATREEEAVGIVAGACMAGMRGIVLMQTSRLRHARQRARLAARARSRSRC